MSTCTRVHLTGTVEVALPPQDAFALFTPSGERRWARGWDPRFPSPVADETAPGTVFHIAHAGRLAIWTVVRRDLGASIEYSTTTPDERAGLITVTLAPSPTGTTATVTYVLTSLTPEANAELDGFAADYPGFLAHWQHAIARAISDGSASPW